jgi:M6 family metalloprotease-like protein
LVSAALIIASAARGSAAPHLTGVKQEPLPHARVSDRARAAATRKLRAAFVEASEPTRIRVLILRVDFPPDTDPTTTGTGEWADASYAQLGDPDYWVSTDASRFASYYAEVSYGRLAVDLVAMPPAPAVYRLPQTMKRYGNESDTAIQNLIYDSVTAAGLDPKNPVTDLTPYDAILIVHAGLGEESDVAGDSSDDVWSLYYSSSAGVTSSATGLSLTQTLRDGQPIREAIIMPQTDCQDGVTVDPLGVYVHEFGHWLGLPDLYCTALLCAPDGVGKWSLMGDGMYNRVANAPFGSSPAHLDAWSKAYLGWVMPVEASSFEPGSVLLGPVETGPAVYKLPASSDPAAAAQYFLLENRQLTEYDAGLPGHGLLVWLIDEAIIGGSDCNLSPASRFCQNTINNSPLRPGVKLVEADGDNALQKYGCSGTGIDCGNGADPFPGTSTVVSFTPVTVPGSNGYSSVAWVNLRNITEDAATGEVALEIGFGPHPPENVVADASGNVYWTAAAGDATDPAVAYKVYRQGVLATTTPLAAARFRDPAPQPGVTYRVTALDAAGNESALSAPALVLPHVLGAPGDARCFIATAAYGSYLDPHVKALRAFRDRHLLTNAAGRAFVAFYYRWSPPAAELIRRHEGARRAARWAIAAVVAAVEHPAAFWIAASGAAVCALSALTRRRRPRARGAA